MPFDYELLYLDGADALPLSGEFDPAVLPEPWKSLNEAKMDQFPWGGDYRPACAARVGWNERGIHALLYAYEPEILAEVTQTGGMVCNDSCLEFFLAPDAAKPRYVNCEMNPLCVAHIGLGDGRHGRTVLQAVPAGFNATHSEHRGGWWAVSYTLPADFLRDSFGVGLRPGLAMRGNFYKCGDRMRRPHYCMFKPYDTPQPDYHRPELFADFRLSGRV